MNRVIKYKISPTGRPKQVPPMITSLTRRITLSNGIEGKSLVTKVLSTSIMTPNDHLLIPFTHHSLRLPSRFDKHGAFHCQIEAKTRRTLPQRFEYPFPIRLS